MPLNKSNLKQGAIKLRQEGYSYELIAEKIGVSKSTLCDWLKLIPYKHNQEVLERMGRGRIKSSVTLKKLRLKRLHKVKRIARLELGEISKRDLMLLGIGLYIGEGGKYSNGFIQFSNSDPKVIKLAMSWFIKILKIDIGNFYLILHTYPDNNVEETLKYWSGITNVPIKQFGKTHIDRRLNKSIKNKGKLPYGTLHIRIRGLSKKYARVGLYQKMLAWIDIIEEHDYAGIV